MLNGDIRLLLKESVLCLSLNNCLKGKSTPSPLYVIQAVKVTNLGSSSVLAAFYKFGMKHFYHLKFEINLK